MRADVGFLLATALFAPIAGAAAQRVEPYRMERTGGLASAGLHEISGVAVSRAHPGVLWTHNDSGDGPFLYAITLEGELLSTYRVEGAQAVDWEDIALGPCPAGFEPGSTCLFIADTGDNTERRDAVTVYVVREPVPEVDSRTRRSTRPARAIRIRYATGPQDVEAVATDPTGNLMLVTKGRSGPILRYTVPRARLLADSLVLVSGDTVPIAPFPILGRWITGAAVSPSGQRAVLRTHTELFFFERKGNAWELAGQPCWLQGREPQGEGVDFLDEELVVTISERAGAAEGLIFVVGCPSR